MAFPAPLTPAASDLRDFGFMPLEIVRFRGSDLLTEDAEIVLAAILLWTAAWHETPAASLSDDDKVLARAAGYGRAVEAFQAVKAGALRGFVKCSDGRLYHPVVARLANDAWKGKVEQRWRTEVARRKKHNERHPDRQLAIPHLETFARFYPGGCPDDTADFSQRQLALVATTGAENGDDIGCKGQGKEKGKEQEKGKGKGKGQEKEQSTTPKPPLDGVPDLMALTQRITQAAGVSIIRPTTVARELDIVKRWTEAVISIDATILPTIAKRLADLRDRETVGSLAYFDAAILKAHALKGSAAAKRLSNGGIPLAPLLEIDQDDDRIIRLRGDIRDHFGGADYDRWLAPGRTALAIEGTGLIVKVRKGFDEYRINENFGEAITVRAHALGLESVRIVGI